jgi:hypothetical protein
MTIATGCITTSKLLPQEMPKMWRARDGNQKSTGGFEGNTGGVRYSDHILQRGGGMTSGTVPSPPEASTRGAGMAGCHSDDKEERRDIRRVNRGLIGAPEAPVQNLSDGEPKPDSPSRSE